MSGELHKVPTSHRVVREEVTKEVQTYYYNRNTKELPSLAKGDIDNFFSFCKKFTA